MQMRFVGISILCALLLSVSSCKKEDDEELTTTTSSTSGEEDENENENNGNENTNGGNNIPDHCSNGEFDYDLGEYDTDCGGECETCAALTPPCDVEKNKLFFENDIDIPLSEGFTSFHATTQSTDDIFTITAHDGSLNGFSGIAITCFGPLPESSRRYKIGEIVNHVEEGEANARYFTPVGDHHLASSGHVWIIKEGNQWRAILCDAEVHYNNTTSPLDVLSVNVPFDPS